MPRIWTALTPARGRRSRFDRAPASAAGRNGDAASRSEAADNLAAFPLVLGGAAEAKATRAELESRPGVAAMTFRNFARMQASIALILASSLLLVGARYNKVIQIGTTAPGFQNLPATDGDVRSQVEGPGDLSGLEIWPPTEPGLE